MKKRTRIAVAVLIAIITAIGIAIGVYANDYYRAVDVEAYMTDGGSVSVSEIREGYFFDGPGEDDALIFYPGAKVEETAYSPIMRLIAEQGIDCFLIKMPMKLALFGMNKADSIVIEYKYDNYYLAGHSLGGAMAANYAAKHTNDYSGLFLIAAYPTENLTGANFPTVFIYGDNDKVINREKLTEGFSLVPDTYSEAVINGGNHAGFGSYGAQKGDGDATVPAETQWQITADTIVETVRASR